MPKSPQLDKLTQKRNQLNAKIQQLKNRERAKERKLDTRRKILLGSIILKMVRNGDMSQEKLHTLVDKHITREHDRQLFGLQK